MMCTGGFLGRWQEDEWDGEKGGINREMKSVASQWKTIHFMVLTYMQKHMLK